MRPQLLETVPQRLPVSLGEEDCPSRIGFEDIVAKNVWMLEKPQAIQMPKLRALADSKVIRNPYFLIRPPDLPHFTERRSFQARKKGEARQGGDDDLGRDAKPMARIIVQAKRPSQVVKLAHALLPSNESSVFAQSPLALCADNVCSRVGHGCGDVH